MLSVSLITFWSLAPLPILPGSLTFDVCYFPPKLWMVTMFWFLRFCCFTLALGCFSSLTCRLESPIFIFFFVHLACFNSSPLLFPLFSFVFLLMPIRLWKNQSFFDDSFIFFPLRCGGWRRLFPHFFTPLMIALTFFPTIFHVEQVFCVPLSCSPNSFFLPPPDPDQGPFATFQFPITPPVYFSPADALEILFSSRLYLLWHSFYPRQQSYSSNLFWFRCLCEWLSAPIRRQPSPTGLEAAFILLKLKLLQIPTFFDGVVNSREPYSTLPKYGFWVVVVFLVPFFMTFQLTINSVAQNHKWYWLIALFCPFFSSKCSA